MRCNVLHSVVLRYNDKDIKDQGHDARISRFSLFYWLARSGAAADIILR
jgi:hypothetical protein